MICCVTHCETGGLTKEGERNINPAYTVPHSKSILVFLTIARKLVHRKQSSNRNKRDLCIRLWVQLRDVSQLFSEILRKGITQKFLLLCVSSWVTIVHGYKSEFTDLHEKVFWNFQRACSCFRYRRTGFSANTRGQMVTATRFFSCQNDTVTLAHSLTIGKSWTTRRSMSRKGL